MGIIDRSANLFRLGMRLRQYARHSLGRVLGTVTATDGRYRWFIDNQERSLFMRAELNALVGLLIRKGVFTQAEWEAQWEMELEAYGDVMAKAWPEIRVSEDGKSYTLNTELWSERVKQEGWPQ